jgi:sugar lactone lactonase YvrE
VGPVEITNLPAGLGFAASRMLVRNGHFYFISLPASRVIVTDTSGAFQKQVELLPLLEVEDRRKSDIETIGFTVDGEGNLFFTVPTLFKVFKVSPDGKVTSFGRPGSPPGRFGILSGIATDSRGNLLVADKLKCVIMVFDKNFNFLAEFGYRGARPENLIQPDDLAIDRRDRLYVSQGRRRGVSVFALAHD